MKNLTIASFLLLLIALGAVVFLLPKVDHQDAQAPVIVQTDNNNVGSATGPELPFSCILFGGYRKCTARTTVLNQATSSVLCAMLSPISTSTLNLGSIQLSTATSGVTSLSITKSTAPAVIGSTVLASTTVASGAQITFNSASSTQNGQAITDRIFAPSTYLVIAQQAGGVLNQTGACQAEWTVF